MTAKSYGQNPTTRPAPRGSHLYQEQVLSGEVIYNGAIVAKDESTGKWVEATSTDDGNVVYGWAQLGDADNFNGTTAATLTPIPEMLVRSGSVLVAFASVRESDEGRTVYVVDDQTGTLTPGGKIMGVLDKCETSTSGFVFVDPLVNKALAAMPALGSKVRKARAVATSIGANTGTGTGTLTITATGALGAQDTVAVSAGDVIFIQEGTANVADIDAGPWVITTYGTTGVSAVLTRPSWWAHGGAMLTGTIIDVGGEGTRWAGSQWKCFATTGTVIDTTAPTFWPRYAAKSVTAVAGVLGGAAITDLPIRSATFSQVVATNQGTASNTATRGAPRVTAITAGKTGSASVTLNAESAPGTVNASDVGVYTVGVTNW